MRWMMAGLRWGGAWTRMLPLALLSFAATATNGQETFPSRPITLTIGQPPGGAQDVLGRVLAPIVSERLGQPVVVENRPGAGGVVALAATARGKPDGYLISLVGSGGLIASLMTKDLPFDPAKDLGAVAMLTKLYSSWVTTPGSRFASLNQLIAEAKAKPETISFTALGGGGRIMLARIQNGTGARFNLIPYTSGAASVTALLGGHVDVAMDTVGNTRNYVRAGKVRPLAVTSLGPNDVLPGVPPLSTVVPGLELASWTGVFGPQGIPADRLARLNQAFNQALQNEKVRQSVINSGNEPAPGTPADFAGYIAREINTAMPLIKQYNLAN